MRQLYCNEKDLSIRLQEMRQLFWRQVEEDSLDKTKKRLEQALRIEFAEALGAGPYERRRERRGYRGGYRYRDLQTWGGRLVRIQVPKGEKGYRYKLLEPWARRVEKFGEAVQRAVIYGMSDRKVARFFEKLYGEKVLSPAGVSEVYRSLSREIEAWHERPLSDEYRFIFLDGMWQSVRQSHRNQRVILAAYGVRPDGQVEVIDYRIETGESALAWGRFLQSLYERGLRGGRLALVVHDGCRGLMDALRWIWPQARTQVCSVHHLRNLSGAIRAFHVRRRVIRQARKIYAAQDRTEAWRLARQLERRWRSCEPRAIRNFMKGLDRTLGYMDFDRELWPLLKSTNPLERQFGEWRRRLKIMGALPNQASCDRIIFGLIQEFGAIRKRVALKPKSELLLT